MTFIILKALYYILYISGLVMEFYAGYRLSNSRLESIFLAIVGAIMIILGLNGIMT